MKFTFSQKSGKYIASENGAIVDSDYELADLLRRHGMLEDEPVEEYNEDAQLIKDFFGDELKASPNQEPFTPIEF